LKQVKKNGKGEQARTWRTRRRNESPPIKKHLELEIKTLENAPRDADKLERLLQVKRRQKEEEAMHIEDTQRLVTEIEMLQVILYLVCRKYRE
jgi:hypothetical protein